MIHVVIVPVIVYVFGKMGSLKGSWGCGCMQVLIDFQENPKAAQEHTKNPMVMNKIQKLVSAGIVQIR